jgi:hypothetical protein
MFTSRIAKVAGTCLIGAAFGVAALAGAGAAVAQPSPVAAVVEKKPNPNPPKNAQPGNQQSAANVVPDSHPIKK